MERRALYEAPPRLPIASERPREREPGCRRCPLHAGARTVCMPADGGSAEQAGPVLLVIGEAPTREDDQIGAPMVSATGRMVRSQISRLWPGRVVYTNALGCPAQGKIDWKNVNACRGYLRRVVDQAKPDRILLLGTWAFASFVGEALPPLSVRRGYAYLDDAPVFLLNAAAPAMRNRFVRTAFDSDLKHALTCEPPKRTPVDATFGMVRTRADALEAVADLRADRWFGFDVEWSGAVWDDREHFRVLCLTAARRGCDDAWAWDEAALNDPETADPLWELMRDPSIGKHAWGAKADFQGLKCGFGVVVENLHGDGSLWRKQLESDVEAELSTQSWLVGMGGHKAEAQAYLQRACQALAQLKNNPTSLLPGMDHRAAVAWRRHPDFGALTYAHDLVPVDVEIRYCARDTVALVRIDTMLEPTIFGQEHTRYAWERIIKSSSWSFARLEEWGLAVDVEHTRQFAAFLRVQLDQVEQQAAVHGRFEIGNPQNVEVFLFDKLGLRSTRQTPSGKRSTDADALEDIVDDHPVVSLILEHRRLDKLRSTYADGLLEHVRVSGRVHPRFKIDGTRTGRSSTTEPNLANIPRTATVESTMAKDCYVAPRGRKLIEVDLSQIEYRMAALLSGDPKMIAAFQSGEDFHWRTARLISKVAWGVDPTKVTEHHRSLAKTVVFGLLYGKTARTLAMDLGITVAAAQRIVDAVMGEFVVLKQWLIDCKNYARKHGVVWTYFLGQRARCRQLWDIGSDDDKKRSTAENGSGNTPCQGSAAFYVLTALEPIIRWIDEDGIPAKVVNTVYDSILLEADNAWVDDVAAYAKDTLESYDVSPLKLVADVKVGPSWGSLKKWVDPRSSAQG